MSLEKKVVELNAVKRDLGNAGAQLPLPLSRLKDAFTNRVNQLCNDVYHNADDILFQRADQAKNGDEQVAYFNAMRVLRLSRKSIEIAFTQNMHNAFTNMAGSQKPVAASPIDIEKLTLMDHDILEHNVAVETMLGRALELYTTPLGHLVLRFQCLLPNAPIMLSELPVGPQMLINAFSAAMSELDLDIRPKLVFLKLFDKFVICRLGPLYEATNNALVKQGVMPDLRQSDTPVSRRPASGEENYLNEMVDREAEGDVTSEHSQTSPQTSPQTSSINENPAQLQALRQAIRSSGLHSQLTGGQIPAGSASASIDLKSIIEALSKAQFSQAFAPEKQITGISRSSGKQEFLVSDTNGQDSLLGELDDLGGNDSRLLDFSSLFKNLMEANRGATYSRATADVISLVSMLFEYVLEDTQIPEKMRALIARLQIPLLKTALLDKSFFNAGGHPARQLLNEISRSTIGWEERQKSGRDHLYEKIETSIQRVLVEFDSNISVFGEVLEDFKAFLDVDRRRAELVARRIQDAEEGKARSEEGQKYVDGIVNQAISGRQIPKSLIPLIGEAWKRVMLIAYLKEGASHPQWRDYNDVLTELVWSIDPDSSGPDARKRLLRNMPRMLCAIREGLAGISYDAVKSKYLLAELERAHEIALQKIAALPAMRSAELAIPVQTKVSAIQSKPAAGASTAADDAEKAIESHADEVLTEAQEVEIQSLIKETYEQEEVKAERAAITETTATEAVVEKTADAEISANVDATATVISNEATEVVPVMSVAAAASAIARFQVGAWFELRDADGSQHRCKLAALIKSIGKYVFINRSGAKVLEVLESDLVTVVLGGRLSMLDDGQIFDRALESIIGGMRR